MTDLSIAHPSAAPDSAGFVLTPIQAGMIYEILAQSDASVNLEQVVVHMDDEAMDVARMAQAWTDAIARHPAMRLAVRQDEKGRLLQYIESAFAVPLVVEDWTAVQNDAQALANRLAQDRQRGVDLSRPAGWRLLWLRHGPRRSTLIWTFSHVALDGRSFRAILQEVFAAYDGDDTAPPERPAFRAHCEALAVADTAPAKQFFATYLAGFDTPTPIGFAASAQGDDSAGLNVYAGLTKAQTAALNRRAEQAGASFATMVQAAWALVLARVAGSPEAVFGVTRAGRYLTPHAVDVTGCLITTQPLRVAIGPEVTLDDMLAAIRRDLVAQRPHEGLGLPDIAAACDVPHGQPLFDSLVMVERQSLHETLTSAGGPWRKRRVELKEQGAVPLTLAAYGETCLQLYLEFMPTRIARADAMRYLGYLVTLLQAMAEAGPGVLLKDLVMLPPDEQAELLSLAEPVVPLPEVRPMCIAEAFEAVVARQPEAVALSQVSTSLALSYGDLDKRANQFAQSLRQWGIGPGAVLGLCLPRSVEFVALALAAAKVGAAFLPMDPSYPPEALLHMAEDSAAAMIFAKEVAPWMGAIPVTLVTDALAEDAPTQSPDRIGLSPDRMAYLIYTSGTTGKPKGVAVSQRSFAAHACAAIAAYDLGPEDRVLQFGALSFDVALEEIIPTLLAGACLVLRDKAMIGSPQGFVQAVEAQGVTVLNLPTGFWQVLLAAMISGAAILPKVVRLMIVGGERMPPNALARWYSLPKMPRLMNGYGPTEATITCAFYEAVAPVEGREVPVGRSFGHALAYLRAPDGSLAPKGARAELWVGGDAVALGYLNQPEMTEARFAPDPFAGVGRIYRSGDVAYWAPGDVMVIAGRSDRQIKLRGFRIEPGEVEALLESIPGVAQAHVGVLPGAGRLIGWLRASDPEYQPELTDLNTYIASQLPKSKRPELMFVSDWPQTPGGKTDVRRLPAPVLSAQTLYDEGDVDPQAIRIAEIFAAVLGGDVPSVNASFFDLGGHSLQLLTLIGHIEAAFSTRLTVALVHAQPTPAGLAALLSGPVIIAPGADLCDCLMPIQPLGTGVPIYGVHVLGVNGSFFRPLAKAMGLDQPIFGLTVGLLSADTPTSVTDTATLYFEAIQVHRPTGPVGLVAVSLGSYMALELAQQLRAAGREVKLLAMMDAAGPGGRANIRGLAWLAAHLKLLREQGPSYASTMLGNKVENLRHRLERCRLAIGDRLRGNPSVLTTVDGFVAANAVAIQNYSPNPYAGRMTIIRAQDSYFDSAVAIENGLGWADVAQGGFDVVDVAGDHLSILEEPGVLDVAAAFAKILAQDS